MHIKRLLPFLVSLAIIPITLRAGEVPGDSTDNGKAQTRPKVGLVLAGGGTSMGSIIGGLYALGYTPEEMDEIIKNVDWSQIPGNSTERANVTYTAKQRQDSYLLSFPFGSKKNDKKSANFHAVEKYMQNLSSHGGLINTENSPEILNTLPSGFILGNNVENTFNDLSAGYQDSIDFRSLPIPFACVTTNMLDGSETVLSSGKISHGS